MPHGPPAHMHIENEVVEFHCQMTEELGLELHSICHSPALLTSFSTHYAITVADQHLPTPETPFPSLEFTTFTSSSDIEPFPAFDYSTFPRETPLIGSISSLDVIIPQSSDAQGDISELANPTGPQPSRGTLRRQSTTTKRKAREMSDSPEYPEPKRQATGRSSPLPRPPSASASYPPNAPLTDDQYLLLRLRDEEGLPWKDIADRFLNDLGLHRRVPALQMQYKRLKDRLRVWTEVDLDALHKAHRYWVENKFEIISQKMLDYGVQDRWSARQCSTKLDELDAETKASTERLNIPRPEALEPYVQQPRHLSYPSSSSWGYIEGTPSLSLSTSARASYPPITPSYAPYSAAHILPLSPPASIGIPTPTITSATSSTMQKTPTLTVSHHDSQWLQPGYGPHVGSGTSSPGGRQPYETSPQPHTQSPMPYGTSTMEPYTQYESQIQSTAPERNPSRSSSRRPTGSDDHA